LPHCHVKNNFETINLWCCWWCFCGRNATPQAALTTLPHCHYFWWHFVTENKNNQPAEVFYGIIFSPRKHASENKNNQPAKVFYGAKIIFSPRSMQKLPYAAAARLILFFVFAAKQQMPLPKKAGIVQKLWQSVSAK